MADDQEKTEEPTPKKIEDAKKEGNVLKSAEVVGGAVIFGITLYLLFWSSYTFAEIKAMMQHVYGFIGSEIGENTYMTLTYMLVKTSLLALLPIFLLAMVMVFAFSWMQFGMLVTPLKFDLQKLDPIKGMKNVFSMKKAVEALKLFAKLTVITVVAGVLFFLLGKYFISMMDKELLAAISSMVEIVGYFLATILLIIIIFAIIDFYFTQFFYFKSLRMSKQEIKDEFKNMEGDPQVKGRIRQIQMQMSQKRMMSNVSDADVVVTNPTHYAVAMKYDSEKSNAPLVVAKGIDFLAIQIKDLAREHKIPIVENPSLARALYAQVELDQEIPNEFYKAVADIFSFVYELKKR